MSYKFRIASPCSADWAHMKGDDRVRHCELCNLSVYNFSALSQTEIEDLVAQREGRLCARLYQRTDGTLLTKNCPNGFRAAILRASGLATATLSTLLAIVPAANPQQQKQETNAKVHPVPASISLEIVDASGAVIPGVQVTLKEEATGQVSVIKANDAGRANGINLPKGIYEVTIMSLGFKSTVLTHFAIPNLELQRVQLEVVPSMGVVVTVGELMPERRNPIKKFFAKVRRII